MFGGENRYNIQTLALTGSVRGSSEGRPRPKKQQRVQIFGDLVEISARHYCYMPTVDKCFHMSLCRCQVAVREAR